MIVIFDFIFWIYVCSGVSGILSPSRALSRRRQVVWGSGVLGEQRRALRYSVSSLVGRTSTRLSAKPAGCLAKGCFCLASVC